MTKSESNYILKLRNSGLRPTKQRLKICEVLFERDKTFHFSINDLTKILQNNHNEKISVATVYNTVHAFQRKGHLKEINIGKVKKAELSRELLIPRETIRRKLEDLKKEKFIDIVDGNIEVKNKSFEIKDLNTIITKYSKCLNIILDNLIDDKIVIKKNITEDHLLNNFSKSWLDILSMMIGLSLIWRKFLKSMENWFIFGTCGLNQMYNLKDSKNFRDLHSDNTENFFLNLTQEEMSRGLNPTTISDLTGIPRQTVIRNLKILTKSKALEKDSKRNLFYVPKNTSQQKSIVETLKKVQLIISDNVLRTLQTI